MHEARAGKVTSPIISLGEDYPRIAPVAAIVGLGCLGGSLVVAMIFTQDRFARFSYAYLTNFCFFVAIAIGALWFVMMQHLTKAGWGVTLRRIAEVLAACVLPIMVLFLPLLLPVLLGYSGLFGWNSSQFADAFASKSIYLNKFFFTIRIIAYVAIWSFLAYYLLRRSLAQDTSGDKRITTKMQNFCAPAMLFFVAALVFASFDWEMSLAFDALWYSTIFPVYFFAGAVLSGGATITLAALLLQRSGRITDEITMDHYHDMGKYMFTFVFFWGYIAFSQFMLIWYANMPEETFWYEFRFNPGWVTVSVVLLFGHLLIPFVALLGRWARRSKPYLLCACVWLLVMHWVDHYWLIMPQLKFKMDGLSSGFVFPGLVELLSFLGFAGLFVASFYMIAGNRPLVPLKDPRLVEALNFENP